MIRVHISRLFTKLTSFTAVCLLMGMFAFAAVLPVTSVYAATAPVTAPTCTAGKTGTTETPCIGLPPEATKDKSASNNCTADCGLVAKYAIPFINFLAAMVGVVVTISIVIGGIQYTTSRDNPQATSAAKTRIAWSVVSMLTFLFLYALLQWIVPGGLI